MSIVNELQRRNVFRVGIAYAITAWLIAQIAGLAAASFLAPVWVMKMIITMLILGFPVALVMAWAYELTPEGLRRESEAERGESTSRATASKLDRTIIITLVAALAYFTYDKFVLDPQRDAALLEGASQQSEEFTPTRTPDEKPPEAADQSIAVLPFVNMSDDAGNEYFSEGLSEELLNLLVKIPELRVAARTSSFSYKGTDTKIAQIGKELNVTHVLEGSVRKSGNQVRITTQLIQADDGFHLWSQTYDRTLDNIFVIQDEIAAAVVDGLKITLLGAMPETSETAPEVYSLYLEARYLMTPPRGSKKDLEKTVLAFQQALAIDPDYAPAWVGLAWAYEFQRREKVLPKEQAVALARDAAERALAIDDNLGSAWSTLSYLKKKYDWDWEGAKADINKALQLEPNNVDVLLGAASVASTLGQFDKATELSERAVALDPLGLMGLGGLARTYLARGLYDEAMAQTHRVLTLYPDSPWARADIAAIYLNRGNPERALAEIDNALAEINELPVRHALIAYIAEALFIMGEEEESRALHSEFLNTSAQFGTFTKAQIHAWRGENDDAFKFLEIAFEQHNHGLTNILAREAFHHLEADPRYPVFLEKLGLLEAWKAMPPEYGGPAKPAG